MSCCNRASDLFQSCFDLVGATAIVVGEEAFECFGPGLLQRFQSGPSLEELFHDLRANIAEPIQHLRKIQFEMGVKALREPYPLIDKFPPLLDQETKSPCFRNIGIDAPQLLAMASKKIEHAAFAAEDVEVTGSMRNDTIYIASIKAVGPR